MLANGTLVEGMIVLSGSEPRPAQCSRSLDREPDFGAKNFRTISTGTHIGNLVITGSQALPRETIMMEILPIPPAHWALSHNHRPMRYHKSPARSS